MGARRLDATTRVLCLLGPLLAAFFFVTGRFVIPLLRRIPLTSAVLERVCVWRAVTGVPCPFCGGTRAVELAAHGEWAASLMMNPLGTLLVGGGGLATVWLALCAATGRDLGLTAVGRALKARATPYLAGAGFALLWIWQIRQL
ncbi:MAG: DUF2752 domain-containing protein [Candidatus Brocadiia bacterium]